jgi:hypothetical protein
MSCSRTSTGDAKADGPDPEESRSKMPRPLRLVARMCFRDMGSKLRRETRRAPPDTDPNGSGRGCLIVVSSSRSL